MSFTHNGKNANIILLITSNKEQFSGQNRQPITLLLAVRKLMEKIVYDQIQDYFEVNGLNTVYQHAYRTRQSATTALIQIIDHWVQEIDNMKLVGPVFLDLSVAFDVL